MHMTCNIIMNNYRQHLGNELRYSFITSSFIANT